MRAYESDVRLPAKAETREALIAWRSRCSAAAASTPSIDHICKHAGYSGRAFRRASQTARPSWSPWMSNHVAGSRRAQCLFQKENCRIDRLVVDRMRHGGTRDARDMSALRAKRALGVVGFRNRENRIT